MRYILNRIHYKAIEVEINGEVINTPTILLKMCRSVVIVDMPLHIAQYNINLYM